MAAVPSAVAFSCEHDMFAIAMHIAFKDSIWELERQSSTYSRQYEVQPKNEKAQILIRAAAT